MKNIFAFVLVVTCSVTTAFGQSEKQNPLVDQLQNTHNVKNWFVPVNVALEGLTAEQAKWTDGSGNHSAGQLAFHLYFWNERMLRNFKGENVGDFHGSNDDTFNNFDSKQWEEVVKNLDKVLTEIESIVSNASEAQLKEWAPVIANISAHNAYHTGQIVFVRKLQKTWNPEKGVK